MKKFGTPMRAGPGSASEKVGFAAVGEPSGFSAGEAASSMGLRTLSLARPTPESRLPLARLTGFSSADGRCLRGAVAGIRVAAVTAGAGVPAAGVSAAALRFVGGLLGRGKVTSGLSGVLTGEAVGVGVGVWAGPRSTISWTGAGRPGICTCSTGVPGGTSTVIVSVWPVTNVTCTRCRAADADVTRTTA